MNAEFSKRSRYVPKVIIEILFFYFFKKKGTNTTIEPASPMDIDDRHSIQRSVRMCFKLPVDVINVPLLISVDDVNVHRKIFPS